MIVEDEIDTMDDSGDEEWIAFRKTYDFAAYNKRNRMLQRAQEKSKKKVEKKVNFYSFLSLTADTAPQAACSAP